MKLLKPHVRFLRQYIISPKLQLSMNVFLIQFLYDALFKHLTRKKCSELSLFYSSHIRPTINTRQMQTFRAYCWLTKILLILKSNWIFTNLKIPLSVENQTVLLFWLCSRQNRIERWLVEVCDTSNIVSTEDDDENWDDPL